MTASNTFFVRFTRGDLKGHLATYKDLDLEGNGVAKFATAEDASTRLSFLRVEKESHLSVFNSQFGMADILTEDEVFTRFAGLVEARDRWETEHWKLHTAIETYLNEVAESDDEALIESVEDLAEAINYSFDEEKTVTLTVEVTVKVKRGYGDLTANTFDLDVDTCTDSVEVLDFTIEDLAE